MNRQCFLFILSLCCTYEYSAPMLCLKEKLEVKILNLPLYILMNRVVKSWSRGWTADEKWFEIFGACGQEDWGMGNAVEITGWTTVCCHYESLCFHSSSKSHREKHYTHSSLWVFGIPKNSALSLSLLKCGKESIPSPFYWSWSCWWWLGCRPYLSTTRVTPSCFLLAPTSPIL